ncbi:MAG: hypothetical protein IJW73_02885 [Candidatus Gastranaerophilales bacterium]|nr:hypothetical protein [Candidatus Gastranaerophilales bacterium]
MEHINSAINSNRNMYAQMTQPNVASNKAHLVNGYYGDKVIYYNDEVAIQKEKKKKRNKILTLAFTGVASLGIVGTLAVGLIKGKIKPNEIGKQVSESKIAKKAKEILDPVVNVAVNFSNIKDDVWTRYTHKNKYLNKANEFLENIYHGFAKKKYQANYDKSYTAITEALGNIEGVENFDGWFSKMLTGIKENLGLDGKAKRITEGLLDDVKENPIKGTGKLFKKLSSEVLSDARLEGVKAEQIKRLTIDGIGEISDDLYSKDANIAKKAFDALVEQLEKSGKIKNGASAVDIANHIKNLNQIKTKGAHDLFERIRDTALGNASTDTLGVIASLGLLGGSLATAEDKTERKSTMINLGIPLLVTLGSMVYGTAMCFAGGVALAFGLVTGEVAKRGAKLLDNTLKQKAVLKAENEKKEYLA